MKMKRIGGLEVSAVGLGTNNFGTEFFGRGCTQEETTRIINAALDAGVNFFDTAEEYSTRSRWGTGRSEEFIRVALGARRNDVVIASKFMVPQQLPEPGLKGRQRITEAVEGSLRRLGTDRIDLYQQHFPDPTTPIDEHLEALDRLVKDGKVREIGHSNFTGAMMDEADAISRERGLARFVTSQSQYSLLDLPPEAGALEACERHGLKVLPYYPLASGLLTGKYRRGAGRPEGSRFDGQSKVIDLLGDLQVNDARIAVVEKLDDFARDHGHTILELAISWLASQSVVGPIIAGATKPEQVTANAKAACWDLTDQDFRDIDGILKSAGREAQQPYPEDLAG
jgi:aryl-alcohol dehydrogenase-like predicted oxidoreductase